MGKWYEEFIGTKFADVAEGHSHYVLVFEKDDGSLIGIKIPKDGSCEVVDVEQKDIDWSKYMDYFTIDVPPGMPHHGDDYVVVRDENRERW